MSFHSSVDQWGNNPETHFITLNVTSWNLQTPCRIKLPNSQRNLPRETGSHGAAGAALGSALPGWQLQRRLPLGGGGVRRWNIGVAAVTAAPDRIRLSHLVTGGQAELRGLAPATSAGSHTVHSAVIFGNRITLCHEMDLLILQLACARVCVWESVWVCVCMCVFSRWYDP